MEGGPKYIVFGPSTLFFYSQLREFCLRAGNPIMVIIYVLYLDCNMLWLLNEKEEMIHKHIIRASKSLLDPLCDACISHSIN